MSGEPGGAVAVFGAAVALLLTSGCMTAKVDLEGKSHGGAAGSPATQPTKPAPGATPVQRSAIRVAIVKAIATSSKYGPKPLLASRRTYSAANISGPNWGKAGSVFAGDDWFYCVKFTVDNLTVLDPTPKTMAMMFTVFEGAEGVRVSGTGVYVHTRCPAPFEPFPELEAVNNVS